MAGADTSGTYRFLTKYDLLKHLPGEFQLPPILKKLEPGQLHFFKEDTPKKAYNMLKDTEPYSIERLCVTKLPPKTIKKDMESENLHLFG